MAFRCLPITTRELFESTTKDMGDYPTIEQLLECVQSRVSMLEIVGDSRTSNVQPPAKTSSVSRPPKRKGDNSRQSKHHSASLLTTKPEKICSCCKANHGLDSCAQFLSWVVGDRSK